MKLILKIQKMKKKLINFCQQNMKSSRFDLDRRIPNILLKE